MNVIAITQARTGSTRLPNKILKQIEKTSLLEIHLNRVLKAKKIDALIVATTTNSKDIAIVELCEMHNTQVFRGSENDVLDRFYKAWFVLGLGSPMGYNLARPWFCNEIQVILHKH